MKKNTTVTLDPVLAQWAKVEAAKRMRSLSKFIESLLREKMESQSSSHEAMKRFIAREGLTVTSVRPLPKREELYDR